MKRRTQNIYLIGFMGSGKTTLGKKLALHLDWEFLDTDTLIEDKLDMDIPQIFNKYGEDHFRFIENKILNEIVLTNQKVVATGGGLPCFNENLKILNKKGISYYLNVAEQTIFERLKRNKATRPLIANFNDNQLQSFIHQKIKERKRFYTQANYVVTDADQLLSSVDNHFKD